MSGQDATVSPSKNLCLHTDTATDYIQNLRHVYTDTPHTHRTRKKIFHIVTVGENGISNFTSSLVFNGILNVEQMFYLVNFFIPISFFGSICLSPGGTH